MPSLFWLQSGGCSGDSMALLNAEEPDLHEFIQMFNIDLLWHPSLSELSMQNLQRRVDKILNKQLPLDYLCIEGSVINAPNGTGMYDTYFGKAKKTLIADLAEVAEYVIAIGTCASFGGVSAAPPNPSESTGLQFLQGESQGFLSSDWRSRAGFPVINLSGCPVHPATVINTLSTLIRQGSVELDDINRPIEYYSTLVHQGCTRNEYHEYGLEEVQFGNTGCLYYNLGCQGPNTLATCNRELWNRRSSKTRAGVPCFGCTSPSFPMDIALFETPKIGKVPITLPLGVNRPNYMAYKGLAEKSSPERIKDRKMLP